MTTPSEKLADSLVKLKALQGKGLSVFKTNQLSRTHRERLLANGFIKDVFKGYYISTRPDEATGESTSWYASYWEFSSTYLNDRFKKDWWLSPEQSVAIHSENWAIPQQLLIKSSKGKNNKTELLFGTSIFDMYSPSSSNLNLEVKNDLRILTLASAVIHCSPNTFLQSPIEMRTALAQITDTSELLSILLKGGHSVIAGRLVGAFRNMGKDRMADDILSTMKAAGYDVRELDPFEEPTPSIFDIREKSPYVNRIRMMWHEMRTQIIPYFPEASELPKNKMQFLKEIDELFITDAYHSLSIEGYKVSEQLIENVRIGAWNPDTNQEHLQQKNAMAARGYWEAFQLVKGSIEKILSGEDAAKVIDYDHSNWYRALFAPSVTSGLLDASDLSGYRNRPVFIKNSLHVPLSKEALRDTMPILFELINKEENVAMKAVLGHFIFVYIHPFIDGNGRIARFLMNTILSTGGYPWTIIKVENRDQYMQALESASTKKDIRPFAQFISESVKEQIKSNQ
jgi:hypothetical protein